ncbi:DUF2147 domain-containing protein [Ampullimonas aquatilis]|uniref:DUF2147 domain-containing protein n=1 Tax=Ampullimonas aquatilis TaxID=1341549 RepID=UPI003C7099A5
MIKRKTAYRKLTTILLSGLLLSPLTQAADDISGTWTTIDDETGKPKAVVLIEEKNGVYEGRIEKTLIPPPNPLCDKCEGPRHNQPILGLTFLNGLKRNGQSYQDGEILDPKNGKVYRAKATLSSDGQKLEVRGFIGISLIGRSQTWLRGEQ